MRSALVHVPKGQHTMVAAAIRQAFLQPDAEAAQQTWRHVADQLRARWPELGTLMDDSEHNVLAYITFLAQHRTKLRSTNPLERQNKEVQRDRTHGVQFRASFLKAAAPTTIQGIEGISARA
jgi:putative transposase